MRCPSVLLLVVGLVYIGFIEDTYTMIVIRQHVLEISLHGYAIIIIIIIRYTSLGAVKSPNETNNKYTNHLRRHYTGHVSARQRENEAGGLLKTG